MQDMLSGLFCLYSCHVIGYGVEEEDRKHTWMEDSEAVSFGFFTFYNISLLHFTICAVLL